MNIGKQQFKYRQTAATDVEIEQLKKITGKEQTGDAVREAILRTINGA